MAKVGRPMKWQSVAELSAACDAYFDSCWETTEVPPERKKDPPKIIRTQIRPYTITGLALALDTTRDVLIDYEKLEDRAEFSYTIKKAKMRCQNYAEEFLFTGKAPAGPIFNLKNNYGWHDRQEMTGADGGPIKTTVEVRFVGPKPKNNGRVS